MVSHLRALYSDLEIFLPSKYAIPRSNCALVLPELALAVNDLTFSVICDCSSLLNDTHTGLDRPASKVKVPSGSDNSRCVGSTPLAYVSTVCSKLNFMSGISIIGLPSLLSTSMCLYSIKSKICSSGCLPFLGT